jgi:methanogenic corrinoid protein MtbC1
LITLLEEASLTAQYPEIIQLRERLVAALVMVDRLAVRQILTGPGLDLTTFQRIEEMVTPALDEIGAGWESGLYSLSQVYMSGRICEEEVDTLLPPSDPARRNQPKMAIVTLEDYHMLGKRIVYSVLRANGFELANYGRMEVVELAERVLRDRIQILLVSVLMLPSALKVKELRARLDLAEARVRIVVGGAPFRFDGQLWREVGADAFGETAAEAVRIVRRMAEEIA